MTHEQRKEYIRQAKRAFYAKERNQYNIPETADDNTKPVAGYWKARLIVAVIIFVVIFSYHQTKTEQSILTHEKLVSMIEKDMDVQTVQAWFEQ